MIPWFASNFVGMFLGWTPTKFIIHYCIFNCFFIFSDSNSSTSILLHNVYLHLFRSFSTNHLIHQPMRFWMGCYIRNYTDNHSKWFHHTQGCHWSGKFKVREKSGNFRICQGNLEFCWKSGKFKKSQGNLWKFIFRNRLRWSISISNNFPLA